MSYENAAGQYAYMEKIVELYGQLQDELSKEIFWARLKCDTTISVNNALNLFALTGMLTSEEIFRQKSWRTEFESLNQQNKKILFYGCNVGKTIAEFILNDGQDFYGFCDRNADKFKMGILGKPVVHPDFLLKNKEQFYIIISTMDYYSEIYEFLLENKFPEDYILPYFCKKGVSFSTLIEKQYFDFPQLYRKNTAFVDGGCFNGDTTLRFANWCNGKYSKIIAFEPDIQNYQRCNAIIKSQQIKRVELHQAGLSNVTGISSFVANANSGSFFVDTGAYGIELSAIGHGPGRVEQVQTIALDDISYDTEIGFIKLDVEGEEFHALQGAEKTIRRDKPLLAISVYHRRGDMLAIMDFLHTLVPEYHFWLRHYCATWAETVLYASL